MAESIAQQTSAPKTKFRRGVRGRRSSQTPAESFVLVVLAVLAVFLNVLNFPVIFGVDFIFGGVAVLLAVAAFGMTRGCIIAIISSAYTYFLWNHPYQVILAVTEALFVGMVLRRTRYNLLVADGMYWLILGAPITWFTYKFILGLPQLSLVLIVLKTLTNGIFNALIASIILTFAPLPLRRRLMLQPERTVFQVIFHLMAAAVFLPSLMIVVIDSRETLQSIQRSLYTQLHATAKSLASRTDMWFTRHLVAVRELASVAKANGIRKTPNLQFTAATITQIMGDFHNMYVADANGTAVVFYPELNRDGQRTVGANFSDRNYFKEAKRNGKPVISDVFVGRVGTEEPIITISAPILKNGQFSGLALGAVNLDVLTSFLRDTTGQGGFNATLVSPTNLVVASTREDLRPMHSGAPLFNKPSKRLDGNFFQILPTESKRPPVLSWQDSQYQFFQDIPNMPGWRIALEAPLAPFLPFLYEQYINRFMIVMTVALLALLIAYIFADRLTAPLSRLAKETRGLPDKIVHRLPVELPPTWLIEIKDLTANFETMAAALKERFDDLEDSTQRLQTTNLQLTHEVNERRRMEEELRKHNRLKDEFLASLSHELRTPLNVITGYVELIRDEGWNEAEGSSFMDIINRNVRHLTSLIEDLLDMSRIVTGKFVLNRERVLLSDLLAQSIESARLSADAKHIRLTTNFMRSDVAVQADPIRLQQVFTNLLSNSIKFTPEGGMVEVTLTKDGPDAEIRIRDTGEGISPEFIPRMFSRFLQEDGTLRRTHGGLGLGLAIVREIVEIHGGRVRGMSDGKGKGTTIIVNLPLYAQAQSETHLHV